MRQSAPSPWFRCQAGRPRGHSLVPVGCRLGAGGTGVQGGMQSRGPTMPASATEAQCKAWGHFALSCFPRTEPAWGLQPASPKPPPPQQPPADHLGWTSAMETLLPPWARHPSHRPEKGATESHLAQSPQPLPWSSGLDTHHRPPSLWPQRSLLSGPSAWTTTHARVLPHMSAPAGP